MPPRAPSNIISKPVNAPAATNPDTTSVKVTYGKPSSREAVGRKNNMTSLVYPLENQEDYQASIKFEVHSIDPYDINPGAIKSLLDQKYLKQLTGQGAATPSDGTKAAKEKEAGAKGSTYDDAYLAYEPPASQKAAASVTNAKSQEQAEQDLQNGAKTNRDLGMTTKDMNRRVKLYFPIGVTMQDNAQYDNASLGPSGAVGLASLGAGNSLMSSMFKGAVEGLANIFNFATGTLSSEAAQLAAARLAQKFSGTGLGQAAQIGLQVRINPNARTMFQGVTIRQFTFSFKFFPKSSREAEEVRQIVKLFRTELYPATIGTQNLGVPLGYKFPNVFKISFQYGNAGNQFLPQPLLCYLRDVNTTYNSSSMSWHEDGSPTEIDMSLSFQEFRALTREDVENGSDGSIKYEGTH